MEIKIKVGVFFGGKSTEHEVSIISALQAIKSIDTSKYEVVPVYIAKDSSMYCGVFVDDIEEYTNIEELIKKSIRVIPVNNGGIIDLVKYPKKLFSNPVYDYIDVAFPIVHGTNVEDGVLAGYFKTLGVPFVGPDVLGSALGMDKYAMKLVLKDAGVPVLDALEFNNLSDEEDIIKKSVDKFGYPVIVKPVNLGSSIGITKVKDRKSFEEALETAFKFSQRILIEKAIVDLREINCSVLGDYEEAIASECEEPVSADDILTFEEKYISGKGKKGAAKGVKTTGSKGMANLQRKLPADIPASLKKEIQGYAIKTFKALQCSGVSRIDFLLDSKNNKVYVNEINTIPGSLSFYLWNATNVKYGELLDRLIKLALKRDREEKNLTFTFESSILSGINLNGLKGTKGVKKF